MSYRRIAMWSGPRNISTAMMRAFENRNDASVIDEPFYACYLAATDVGHPGREEIVRQGPTDWRVVVEGLLGPVPENRPVWFQKHMTHHMLPHIGRRWMLHDEFRHAFLIRSPRQVLISLAKVLPEVRIEQTGLPQQVELYDWLTNENGVRPVIVDSLDVLRNPLETLMRLCEALEIDFADSMLTWPAGPRSTDGLWAKDWYAKVEKSTTFAPPRESSEQLPSAYRQLLETLEPLYDRLAHEKL